MAMKNSKRDLRRECRRALAAKREDYKQQILDTRERNSKVFHKLISNQKGKSDSIMTELTVGQETFKTENEILDGWKMHFRKLAEKSDPEGFDKDYIEQVEKDICDIIDICKWQRKDRIKLSLSENEKAISSINKRKAADINGLTVEHILYWGDELLQNVATVMQQIFDQECIPESLKQGLLTPVYKNKGSNKDAKNYRGITITPVISKIIEVLLKNRIQDVILKHQHPFQRGFTAATSPMNGALLVEEYLRECKDQKKTAYVAFLDVKSAFDVVSHSSLLRKLYNIGIDGQCWNLIYQLHQGAKSSVKWCGAVSESFAVEQGVRQGGLLSTDLFKVYNNPLLCKVSDSGYGAMIGNIRCGAPTVVDDTTFMSDSKTVLQIMLDMAVDNSKRGVPSSTYQKCRYGRPALKS